MDVDVVRKVETEEQKKKFRQEGRCFECHKQGHMARHCPNKKKKPPQGKPQRPHSQFNKQKDRRYKPKTQYARAINLDDSSDDESDYESDTSISEPNNQELNISDLAARTARFNDTERDEWVKEMKKLGVDF